MYLKAYPTVAIYGDEVTEGYKTPCFFINLYPIQSETETKNYLNTNMLVVISYFSATKDSLTNLDILSILKRTFGIVLAVQERCLTIQDIISEKVEDDGYQFSFNMTYKELINFEQEHEPIQAIYHNIIRREQLSLPNVIINFTQAIQRGERSIVALVLDGETSQAHELESINDVADITQLTDKQREYINLAFMGYIKPPKKVSVVFRDLEEVDYARVQTQLEGMRWDYLAIPEIDIADVPAMTTWASGVDMSSKVVLPNTSTADSEKVINFTTVGIKWI